MKKIRRGRLALGRDTLRMLGSTEMREAIGGVSAYSGCCKSRSGAAGCDCTTNEPSCPC